MPELIARLILNCSGSAFQKLQLHQAELLQGGKPAVQKLVNLLGGFWGRIPLEKRYEATERALYRCLQKADESNDSFLARADIAWAELLAKGTTLKEIQAYVMLRGSQLSSEDKKRVILESDNSSDGSLTIERVSKAVRMLGAGFFQELVSGKKTQRSKTYDYTSAFHVSEEEIEESETFATWEEPEEEWVVDTLVAEGDEDAALIADFEAAVMETVQTDGELAAAYTAYQDARKRLADKARFRGFWPVGKNPSKGKGSGSFKGKSKGKGYGGQRKTLQQKILASTCRLCGQKGHWKAECPQRSQSSTTMPPPSSVASFTGLAEAQTEEGQDMLPNNFMDLPETVLPSLDEAQGLVTLSEVYFGDVMLGKNMSGSSHFGNRQVIRAILARSESIAQVRDRVQESRPCPPKSPEPKQSPSHPADILSADAKSDPAVGASRAIVDTGATKTVMGSSFVTSFLDALQPCLRQQVTRCQCQVVFKFGNQGTLKAQHALVLPLGKLRLKISIVPGRTPFLLSGTFLQAVKTRVDTGTCRLESPYFAQPVTMERSARGLLLVDMNRLADQLGRCSHRDVPHETFQTETIAPESKLSESITPPCEALQPKSSQVVSVLRSHGTCHSNEPLVQERGDDRDRGPDLGGAGSMHGQLRQGSYGQDVSRGVDERGQVAPVGGPDIPCLTQSRASTSDQICSAQGSQLGGRDVVRESHRISEVRAGVREEDGTSGSNARDADKGEAQEPAHGDQVSGPGIDGQDGASRGALRGVGIHRAPDRGHGGVEPGGGGPLLEDGQHGGPVAADRAALPDSPATMSLSNCAEAFLSAGDHDSDYKDIAQTIYRNPEKMLIDRLRTLYRRELREIAQHTRPGKSNLDLLEVFCYADSQLTLQGRRLGMRSERFGLEQGDLMTAEGRKQLFTIVVRDQPAHVWISPECKAWSAWSRLNAQRSLQSWDKFVQERLRMLQQVVLGIVVCEWQRSQGRECHWEQPQGSLMLRLPCLQEIHRWTHWTEFDMCQVGTLQDPSSGLPMKKGTVVLTTSRVLHEALHGQKCGSEHVHQNIEGQTTWEGIRIGRAEFTARYSRKFARKVIVTLKASDRRSTAAIHAVHDLRQFESPATKRARLSDRLRSRMRQPWEVPDSQEPSREVKRRRLSSKQEPPRSEQQEWEALLLRISQGVPRVGRTRITDDNLLKAIQEQFPEHEVVACIAGRGADRAIAPPNEWLGTPGLCRRSVFVQRADGKVRIETNWESLNGLSKIALSRKSHSCRLLVTIFSRPRPPGDRELESESSIMSRLDSRALIPEEANRNSPEPSETIPEQPTELTQRQAADVGNPEQSRSFRALSVEQKQWLVKVHQNLGHPAAEKLCHVLSEQGASPELIQAAKELKCSTCLESQRPRLARPATVKDHLDFNDRIALDALTFTSHAGQQYTIYHVLDIGTCFHVAFLAQRTSSQDIIAGLQQYWFAWAGSPGELIVDAASELSSNEFLSFLQGANVRSTQIAPRAHWQNGRSERHGQFLEEMLKRYDKDHPICSDAEMSQALWLMCQAQAKNSLGRCRGFSPELLVLGKQTRLPGSNMSDESLPAHGLAESETAEGVLFRAHLARRESARQAFIRADNSAALRRAMLRRTRPARDQYSPGEWVMYYKNASNIPGQGSWIGPMRTVTHSDQHSVWATMGGKLYRGAPEHFRPVSANESNQIPVSSSLEPPLQVTSVQVPDSVTPVPEPIEVPSSGDGGRGAERSRPQSQSSEQPDNEPEVPESSSDPPESIDPVEVPVPGSDDEELGLSCDAWHLRLGVDPGEDLAWRAEITVNLSDVPTEVTEESLAFIADAAKKQKTEVRMSDLTESEKELFRQAKSTEVKNWLSNKAVEKIARSQLDPNKILRCRWLLTWKPLDPVDVAKEGKTHKAKARLVVLGYLDPELDEIPRDSPTLSRHSRMLILQLIASSSWILQSFDVKAAFLQGRPNASRVIGLEPVPELAESLGVANHEALRLVKGAYGLIDAPFLWYSALREALIKLEFEVAPWDPCVFVLRSKQSGVPDGVIGVHVDDGLCGGNSRFQEKLALLEKQFAFGAHKRQKFCYTGIDLEQRADGGIVLSQSNYVRKIPSIKVSVDRRDHPESLVTAEEKHQLRGLIGSLQYASVHTRPDLSSRLSFLQSQIPKATVGTLVEANRTLHEAKRHHDVSIVIQPIARESVRFLAFSDASFASRKCPDSHAGCIILTTHEDMALNRTCEVSPISWSSRKIQRVVTSTLAAESVALNSALDQLSWLKLYWGWLLDPKVRWKHPKEALAHLPEAWTVAVPFRESEGAAPPEAIATTDCKSLFDLVTRTAPPACAEFRTQLHARAIKDLLQEGVTMRWVHSGAQLADALTKIMTTQFLRETLAQGRYCLRDEDAILKDRLEKRDRVRWLRTNVAAHVAANN